MTPEIEGMMMLILIGIIVLVAYTLRKYWKQRWP